MNVISRASGWKRIANGLAPAASLSASASCEARGASREPEAKTTDEPVLRLSPASSASVAAGRRARRRATLCEKTVALKCGKSRDACEETCRQVRLVLSHQSYDLLRLLVHAGELHAQSHSVLIDAELTWRQRQPPEAS
jgi:hypothetical protein